MESRNVDLSEVHALIHAGGGLIGIHAAHCVAWRNQRLSLVGRRFDGHGLGHLFGGFDLHAFRSIHLNVGTVARRTQREGNQVLRGLDGNGFGFFGHIVSLIVDGQSHFLDVSGRGIRTFGCLVDGLLGSLRLFLGRHLFLAPFHRGVPIGLAAGEPPTRRGFPPSVFSTLPKLMERAGNSDKGSITALYTVLVEGDDMTEPIADETRSILDGHIILSRKLAAANHYPAIDVQASVSRVMNALVTKEHKKAAQALRKVLAKFAEVELLVQIGEYKKGSDKEADDALARINAVNAFLRQGLDEKSTFEETLQALYKVVA